VAHRAAGSIHAGDGVRVHAARTARGCTPLQPVRAELCRRGDHHIGDRWIVAGHRTHGTHWWVLAFVLGPVVSVLVLWAQSTRGIRRGRGVRVAATARTAATGASDLVWSVVVLGCAQEVLNLAPVILTWRLPASPEIAAGFTSMALILRFPILFFPAAQALLLPVLTASSGTVRAQARVLPPKLLAGTIVVVALWVLVAALLAPVVVRVVFGQNAVPSIAVALILAGASVLGGIAQLLQTALVARGGYRRAGLGWIATTAAARAAIGAVVVAGANHPLRTRITSGPRNTGITDW